MQKFRTSVIILVLVICVKCQNDDKMRTLSFNDGIDRRKFYANNLTIDYETCQQVFYDYEDYKDEGCHRTQLPNVTIQEKFGEGIAACCGIHGYMASGSCTGKTKEVKIDVSITFMPVSSKISYPFWYHILSGVQVLLICGLYF